MYMNKLDRIVVIRYHQKIHIQNNTGKIAYAIVSVTASVDTGDRDYKLWSAPTTNSIVGATQVFDSKDQLSSSALFDAANDTLTSNLVPIQDTHFIVLENTSGASPRQIDVPSNSSPRAIVIEQG